MLAFISLQDFWGRTWPRYSRFFTRRILARWLSTFITATMVVIRPFSRLGGPSAYLALSIQTLTFSVQDTLPQQIELTMLNTLVSLVTVAVSTLARYLSSLCPDNSTGSRAIPSVFLIIIAFFAGWVKNAMPRLHLAARIACLIAIFLLATEPGVAADALEPSANFMWIVISPGVICLFSSFLLLPWFTSKVGQDVASTFSKLRECLTAKLDEASTAPDGAQGSANPTSFPSQYRQMLGDLNRRSVQLSASYFQASFELRVGRLSVKPLKPFIGIVEHLRRDLAWGKIDRSTSREPLNGAALELGKAITASMQVVEDVVRSTYEHRFRSPEPSLDERRNVLFSVRQRLLKSRDDAKDELDTAFDVVDDGETEDGRSGSGRDDDSRTISGRDAGFVRLNSEFCLFTVSLLQMAEGVHQALTAADNLLTQYERSSTRLWLPRLSWAWLGMQTPTVYMDQHTNPAATDEARLIGGEHEMVLTTLEAQQGILEHQAFFQPGGASASSTTETTSPNAPAKAGTAPQTWSWNPLRLVYRLWCSLPILSARLALSAAHRRMVNSVHLQIAFKHALGVALLSIPAFLPAESSGARWFVNSHGQWMTYLICHTNPYGLVVMITLSDVPLSWIVCLTPYMPLSLVAAIAIPPIVFAKYLDPTMTSPVVSTSFLVYQVVPSSCTDRVGLVVAVWRGTMICIGIVAALTINTALWPRHCRVMFLASASRTLGLLSQLYLMLGKELFQRTQAFMPVNHEKTLKMELHIRNSLSRLSAIMVAMEDEVSLAPKPMGQYRKTVATLQSALDAMTGLRAVREHIPHKKVVAAIYRPRREFVSCICLALYACEHTFRLRQPLPHFLPSLKNALSTLVSHIEEATETNEVVGAPLAYTVAESEVLADMVHTLEDLIDICRTLFGTATWSEPEEPGWSEGGSLKDVAMGSSHFPKLVG
ncbi:hypothetical protein OF83DRAFT_1166649 [Amylostereum chailletii]|nr:hypothetical protein OF83DRAFT_1166649 [Amylostereum chailletii]